MLLITSVIINEEVLLLDKFLICSFLFLFSWPGCLNRTAIYWLLALNYWFKTVVLLIAWANTSFVDLTYTMLSLNCVHMAVVYGHRPCTQYLRSLHLAAFVLSRSLVASVVFGATKSWQLQEVLDGCKVELTPEVIAEINKVHERFPNPCPWSQFILLHFFLIGNIIVLFLVYIISSVGLVELMFNDDIGLEKFVVCFPQSTL